MLEFVAWCAVLFPQQPSSYLGILAMLNFVLVVDFVCQVVFPAIIMVVHAC